MIRIIPVSYTFMANPIESGTPATCSRTAVFTRDPRLPVAFQGFPQFLGSFGVVLIREIPPDDQSDQSHRPP